MFQALHKILTIQKILLSSSRGQANFRGLEAKAKDLTFEAKAKNFKMCPRGLHLWQGQLRVKSEILLFNVSKSILMKKS